MAINGYIGLTIFLLTFFLLWGAIYTFTKENLTALVISFPLIEWLRVKFVYSLPLLCLSHSQADFTPAIQIASITGQWGVTLLVITVNAVIYRKAKDKILNIILGILIVLNVLAYLQQPPRGKPIRVTLIQPSIGEEEKWDKSKRNEVINKILNMMNRACNTKADLIITPETVFPIYFEKEKRKTQEILNHLEECPSFIILGAITYTIDNKKFYLINRAYLIKEGLILDYYDKIKLVPFGEFVPFRSILEIFKKYLLLPVDYRPGNKKVNFILRGTSIFCSICYEIAFPEFISSAYADLLINITNDMWFGKTIEPYLHLWAAKLRSVENRKFLIRCTNSGISAIINEYGKTEKSLGLFKPGIITHTVYPIKYETFFAKFPWAFIVLDFILLIVISIISISGKVPRRP